MEEGRGREIEIYTILLKTLPWEISRSTLIVFVGIPGSFLSLTVSLLQRNEQTLSKDRIHKWHPITYSFVFVFIILTSLTLKENSFEFCSCQRG